MQITNVLWKRRKTVGSCQKTHGNRKIVKKHEAELKKTDNNNRYEGLSMRKKKTEKMKKKDKAIIRKYAMKIILIIAKNHMITKQATWKLKKELRQIVMKE